MKPSQKHRRNATLFLAILLGVLASIALATTLIDPYGQYGTLPALNPHKAALGSMNSKLALASRGDFRVIFLGSSRTGVGLDPDSPALAPDARAFNLGLSGCGLVEMEAALRFVLSKNPNVDTVLIDMEPSYFSELFQPSPDLLRSLLNPETSRIDHAIGMAVGFETLEHTSHTLRDAWTNAPRADTLKGLMLPQERLPDHYNARKTFIQHFNPKNAAARVAKSTYQSAKIAAVDRMLQICRERNVEAILYISPVHASRLLWASRQPNHEAIAQLKRDLLAAMIAAQKLGARVRLYDFSLPRGENIEPVPLSSEADSKMTHYIDPVHFLPSVGEHILVETLPEKYRAKNGSSAPALGVALTAENLQDVLTQEIELLNQYAQKLEASDPDLFTKLTARAEK